MSTQPADNTSDLNQVVAELRRDVTDLQQWRQQTEARRPPRTFYSTVQAAELIGRTRFTVAAWCRDGVIQAERKPSEKAWRIPVAAVDAWLAGHPTTTN